MAMNDNMIVRPDYKEDAFAFEISDEALEDAGIARQNANFTLGSCTGLSECPG
jgi:hypothetical protein